MTDRNSKGIGKVNAGAVLMFSVDLGYGTLFDQFQSYDNQNCLWPQVYLGNTLCGTVVYVYKKQPYEILCGPTIGSTVEIRDNRGGALMLCEVEIYGIDGT